MYRLTDEKKARIEADAREALARGWTPRDGCIYPFASPEGRHWVAVWILAGGVLTKKEGAQ